MDDVLMTPLAIVLGFALAAPFLWLFARHLDRKAEAERRKRKAVSQPPVQGSGQ